MSFFTIKYGYNVTSWTGKNIQPRKIPNAHKFRITMVHSTVGSNPCLSSKHNISHTSLSEFMRLYSLVNYHNNNAGTIYWCTGLPSICRFCLTGHKNSKQPNNNAGTTYWCTGLPSFCRFCLTGHGHSTQPAGNLGETRSLYRIRSPALLH